VPLVVPAFSRWEHARSPLDELDREQIPPQERFAWQPPELVAVLGEHRQRHWGYVRSLALNPAGTLLASAGEDGIVRLWDAQTLAERAVLPVQVHRITMLAFAPDGQILATGSFDSKLRLWGGLDTGQPVELGVWRAPGSGISTLAFTPDGKTLIVATDNGVWLWERRDSALVEKPTLLVKQPGGIGAVALSRDGQRLASVAEDKTIRLWRLGPEQREELAVLQGHTDSINVLAFSPDGKTLISGGITTVRLWDLHGDTPGPSRLFPAAPGRPQSTYALAFSRDGNVLAIGGGLSARVQVFSRAGQEWRLWHSFETGSQYVLGLALTADGQTLLTADQLVRRWDLKGVQPSEQNPPTGHLRVLSAVAFSHDLRLLASASHDTTSRLWKLGAAQPQPGAVLRGHSGELTSVAFAPQGEFLVSGAMDSTARLWPLGNEAAPEATVCQTDRYVYGVAFAPDGKSFAMAGYDGKVSLWNTAGKLLSSGHLHNRWVSAVAFASDGRLLASGSGDKTVRLWHIHEGRLSPRQELPGHQHPVLAVAMAPEGQALASVDEQGVIKLWDRATGLERHTLKEHTRRVVSLAFAPDGKSLVSAGDNLVVLWDLTAEPPGVGRRWQLPGPVYRVAYAADNRHLALANGNGTVYILRLAEQR
jgi:WD40 repeat protein